MISPVGLKQWSPGAFARCAVLEWPQGSNGDSECRQKDLNTVV